jgi:hypothetical protein
MDHFGFTEDQSQLNIGESEDPQTLAEGDHGELNALWPEVNLSHDHMLKFSGSESAKTAGPETEPYTLGEYMPTSRTFKFFMNVQLALILFLALCWLHDRMWLVASNN